MNFRDPSGYKQTKGFLGGLIHDLNRFDKRLQNDYHKWNKKLLGNFSSWTTDLIHENNRAFKKYLLHKTDYEVSPFGRSDIGRSGLGKSDLVQFFVKPLDRWNPGGGIGRSLGHGYYDKVSKPFFRSMSDLGMIGVRNEHCIKLAYYAYSIYSGYGVLANGDQGMFGWLGQKAGLSWTESLSLSQDIELLMMPGSIYSLYRESQQCHARSF